MISIQIMLEGIFIFINSEITMFANINLSLLQVIVKTRFHIIMYIEILSFIYLYLSSTFLAKRNFLNQIQLVTCKLKCTKISNPVITFMFNFLMNCIKHYLTLFQTITIHWLQKQSFINHLTSISSKKPMCSLK